MWERTGVTERLKIRYPIVQGPFGGGLSSARLVAAVSEAGGLGSFGANHLSPAQIVDTATEIRALTTRPFAMNLWIPLPGEREERLSREAFAANVARLRPYLRELGVPEPAFTETFGERFEDQLAALLEARPPVISVIFGVPPADALAEARRRGIVVMGTATTVDEAVALDRAGVDLIVASGSDAGGHRAAFLRPVEESLVGTFSLIPQVVDAVRAPVIAAGGIGDGRGIVAALALGAQGVQIGTTFLASDESAASAVHKDALVGEHARHTALTRVFSGRPARGIRNRFMSEMEAHAAELPRYPIQNWFTGPMRRAAAKAGRAEYLALWAGQAAALGRRRAAADVFAALVEQTERTLQTIR